MFGALESVMIPKEKRRIFVNGQEKQMFKTTLTVRCVLQHEHDIDDEDHKIRLQGYTRCIEFGCKRNAWVVDIRTQDEGHEIEDDMQHLDDITPESCPHCGKQLTGGGYE